MESIKDVLIKRDGFSMQEAEDLIFEAKKDLQQRLDNGDFPFDFCSEYFGLEPDYLLELLPD